MKKINKRKPQNKVLYITLGTILFAAIALGVYLFAFQGQIVGLDINKKGGAENTVNQKPPTQEQKDAGKDTKDETITKNSSKPAGNGTDADSGQNTQNPSTGKKVIGVTITAANQNNNILQIRSLLQEVVSTGTCTVSLTKQGATTVTKQAGVQALSNSSTCKGFDIPVSELSTGIWQLSISFENETTQGNAVKSITVQ